MQTACCPVIPSCRTSLAGCASNYAWKVHSVSLNAVSRWPTELAGWISLGKFHLTVPTTSSFDDTRSRMDTNRALARHRPLTMETLPQPFAMDFIKPKAGFSIIVALQCKCSTSVFFDLNEKMVHKRKCHPVPFTVTEYTEPLTPVPPPPPPSSPLSLLSSHHSSDRAVVSFSLLWFP